MAIQESLLKKKLFSPDSGVRLRYVSADELDAQRDDLSKKRQVNHLRAAVGLTSVTTCLSVETMLKPHDKSLPIRALRWGLRATVLVSSLVTGFSTLASIYYRNQLELIEEENRYRNGS